MKKYFVTHLGLELVAYKYLWVLNCEWILVYTKQHFPRGSRTTSNPYNLDPAMQPISF